ncbi:coproporphyrinogen dehydrogenase HemZ [Eubacterium sp.]
MIDIQIMPEQFTYDVQSLVKAFYSEHDFKVNQVVDNSYRIVKVYFEDEIRFELYDNDKKLFEGYEKCDFSNRKETKNILKKLLYRGMQIDTGKELPWGDLTGIRPAKIPALLYEEGKKEEEIRRYMKETYMISDEKLDLAMYIAKREHEILKDINYKQGYSLYIGIPFCPTTCLYCSFTSYPVSFYKDKTDTYVDALIKEIEYVGSRLKDRELNSVYIGGGTPTTLEPYQLDKLIIALKDNFDFSTVKEFTVEAGRPDSITSDKLDTLKKHNVSRISINPQTMNQETLDIIGRRHTVEQVVEAFNLAREKGFDNINMDFIIGLPNETVDMVRHSMEETKKLNPESLTVHSLAVKRAARLNTEKEKYQDYTYENNSKLMNITMDYSKEMNMKPYYLYRQKNMAGNQENVGYSVYGKECLYNILMMGDRQDVFALGAGGTTKIMSEDRLSAKRIDNVKNVDQYIDRIDEMIARKKEYFDKL